MAGLSHHGSSIALLERVSVRRGEQGPLLHALRGAGYAEAAVVATCSRTEIYAIPSGGSATDLLSVLAEYTGCPLSMLAPAAERRSGLAAAEHLFRVTGGLESRVIGEVEIYGQVRAAWRAATTAGTAGASLNRLFAAALKAGSAVREQTTLGARGCSLAYRAVELGLAAMGPLVDPAIVVVGTGRMATAAVEHLGRLGQRPQVAARNAASAARLAGEDRVCPLPALAGALEQADLVICATSSAQYVVTAVQARKAMADRAERPLTVVDLSVPRNVDSAVADLPGVRLIDLESMNDDWTSDPELAALTTGTAIVQSAVARYAEDLAIADAGPLIAALRYHVEATCLRELTRTLGARAVGEQDLVRAAHALAGKLLHGPTIAARTAAATGDSGLLNRLGEILGVGPSDPATAGSALAPAG